MSEIKKAETTKPVELAKERVSSLDPHTRGYKETGVYQYKTDEAVESFAGTPYSPPIKPKSDLSPSSVYIEPSGSLQIDKDRKKKEFCRRNPTHPKCNNRENSTNSTTNDENNPYQELGIFSQEIKNVFTPEGRARDIEKGLTDKPIQNMYQATRDNVQLTKSPVVRDECKCADGSIALGYLDTRSGQKDCSACDDKRINKSTPNAYKNYKTKKPRPISRNTAPLRDQIGVSTFGDVNMKGCQTGANDRKTIKKLEANASLNNVISTKQGRGIRTNPNTAVPINPSQSAFSIYDDCNMNIYGI